MGEPFHLFFFCFISIGCLDPVAYGPLLFRVGAISINSYVA